MVVWNVKMDVFLESFLPKSWMVRLGSKNSSHFTIGKLLDAMGKCLDSASESATGTELASWPYFHLPSENDNSLPWRGVNSNKTGSWSEIVIATCVQQNQEQLIYVSNIISKHVGERKMNHTSCSEHNMVCCQNCFVPFLFPIWDPGLTASSVRQSLDG